VLMPGAGLRLAFATLAFALAALALLTAWRTAWAGGTVIATGACLLAGGLFAVGNEGWRHVMSSGVFRARETEFDPATMPLRKQHVKILFYEDAPDATVTVEQGDGIGAPADVGLRINGKPDASTRVDLSTQMLVAHLPMLARPGAKDVFVLGLGSGVSAGALLPYPVERIVVAENCGPVIRADPFFREWNRHALSDPRVRLWQEDARTVLKLRPQLYDVIITQPSNPWTVGVGSVFSSEYYELAASRLKPGGIVSQWFHVYEMHDGIVGLVLRTFGSVFPFVEAWDTAEGDIVILGSREPWSTGPETFAQGFAIDGVRADLAAIGIRSPAALLARQLASQRTAFAIVGEFGPVQSDLFPVLEYAAPEAFYIGTRARMLSRFDERTHQQWLAPAEKRVTLQKLAPDEAQSVFATFASVNDELLDCLRDPGAKGAVPCVFGTNAVASLPASSAGGTTNQEPVWQRIALALEAGDLDQAEQLTSRVLEREPGDLQGNYVMRIIAREKQSQRNVSRPVF
jgi:hypothetical protein